MQIDDLHKKISIKQNSNNGIDVHYNGQHVLHVMPAGGGYVWSPVQSFFATHIGSDTNMPYQQTAAHDEVHTAIADGLAALFDVGLFDAVSGVEVPEDSYADGDCCVESTKMEKTKRLLEFLKESKKKSDRIKNDPCWKGYKMVGMKNKGDKEVPNCVPESVEQIEELTDKQKKIDLNKNGKVDGEDLFKLRNMKKEEVALDEAKGALNYTPKHSSWAVVPTSRKQFVKHFDMNKEAEAKEYAKTTGGSIKMIDQAGRVIKEAQSHQHHEVSKLEGNVLASYKTKEEVALVEEEHPELKKIRDEYEKREGKGSFDMKPHEFSDDHQSWKIGNELHNRYRNTKEQLKKSGQIKEEADLQEAVTVDKKTYNWGKMVTVHHGNKDSYPLHPEHQEAIKNLKDGDKTNFKDETKRIVTAHRIGNSVLLSHPQSNRATSVAHSHFTESLELSEKLSDKATATAKDYIEDFIKSDAPQFKGKSKAERIKMALGAFYSKNESAMSTILGYTKKKPKVEPKEEPKVVDSDKVVKDDSGLYMDKEYAKKYGFMKEEGDGTGQLLGGFDNTDPSNLTNQIARADYRLTASGRKVKRRITFKTA